MPKLYSVLRSIHCILFTVLIEITETQFRNLPRVLVSSLRSSLQTLHVHISEIHLAYRMIRILIPLCPLRPYTLISTSYTSPFFISTPISPFPASLVALNTSIRSSNPSHASEPLISLTHHPPLIPNLASTYSSQLFTAFPLPPSPESPSPFPPRTHPSTSPDHLLLLLIS